MKLAYTPCFKNVVSMMVVMSCAERCRTSFYVTRYPTPRSQPRFNWSLTVCLHQRLASLLELEYLDEAVRALIDDDEVLMAVDGDAPGHIDVVGDTAMERAVDRTLGVHVTGAVQQHTTVALITDDQVRWTVEAQAARLVQLVIARTSVLPANSAYIIITRREA